MDVYKIAEIARELILIFGIIFLSAYSINITHKSLVAMEEITNKIDMMFIRS